MGRVDLARRAGVRRSHRRSPGPRYWENGAYPDGKDDHPVVGVSVVRSAAYARWAGKRLPTDAEWVKAASWPVFAEGCQARAAAISLGRCDGPPAGQYLGQRLRTARPRPVAGRRRQRQRRAAARRQRLGMDQRHVRRLGAQPAARSRPRCRSKSIRGGAFDTYFETQAHCQFQSGESPLARKHNIGFRCALGFCDVAHMTETAAAADSRSNPRRTSKRCSHESQRHG